MSNDDKLKKALEHTDSLPKEWFGEDSPMEAMPNGFDIKDVRLTRIKLEPGEVLSVRIFSDSVDQMSLAMLKRQLMSVFPSNKILLFAMGKSDNMEIDVITQESAPAESSCELPASYCNDCRCGKKERIEAGRKE